MQVGLTNGNAGTKIDFETDLGFSNSSGTFLADFQYRLTRRSRFDFSYYSISRSAVHTLTKDIDFADSTYHANSTVSSFFNTKIYRVSYGYSIVAKPRWEIGALIGFHIASFHVGLAAEGANASLAYENTFTATAPLPDFGIWGGYSFSKKFAITGEFDYLSLKVGDVGGRIVAGNFSLMYHVFDQFDISLGYTGLNFSVTAVKPRLTGEFKWGLQWTKPDRRLFFWQKILDPPDKL